jgi:hypothetical protein
MNDPDTPMPEDCDICGKFDHLALAASGYYLCNRCLISTDRLSGEEVYQRLEEKRNELLYSRESENYSTEF